MFEGYVQPETLDDAVGILFSVWQNDTPESDREAMFALQEHAFMAETHHTIGRTIRNSWLWKDEWLRAWFMARGLGHADDMSSIILTAFWRKLHGVSFDLEKEIKHYEDFWWKQGINPLTLEKEIPQNLPA